MTAQIAAALAAVALAAALGALVGVIALVWREQPDPRLAPHLDPEVYRLLHGESPNASVSADPPVLFDPTAAATVEVLFWARALRTQWADAGVTAEGRQVVPDDAPLGRLIRALNDLDKATDR